MKKVFSFLWETGKIVLFTLILVGGLRMFVFQPFLVRGASMEPNFSNLDYLIVEQLSYRFGDPDRGDVVVFKFPNDPSQRYIKRIIGLPGETVKIEGGKVMIFRKGQPVRLDETSYGISDTPGHVELRLGAEQYFVMGDNRYASFDSRSWGTLSRDLMIGRVLARIFPLGAFAKVEPLD